MLFVYVTTFIICFLFRLLLHHFLFSSHYPSCFCCGCGYKIGNEIRHHRLTQRSTNSNKIPCATTSYPIPRWIRTLATSLKIIFRVKKTKTKKGLEEDYCDYDFNSLLFVECCVMLGTTQQTTPHHSPHSHYPSCLHARARLVIPNLKCVGVFPTWSLGSCPYLEQYTLT